MLPAYSYLPKVIAHRGSSGQAPENTLASLHLAGQQGIKWVEIDVMLSADGIPVIFHDDYLARTSNGEGLIHKTSLQDLKKLDAGSWKDKEYAEQLNKQQIAQCRYNLVLFVFLHLLGFPRK